MKDLLSVRHSNKLKHIEEHHHFDYIGLMEESYTGFLDEGRVLESSECAAFNRLVMSNKI